MAKPQFKEPGMTGVRFSPMYYQGKDDWLNAKASDPLWQTAEDLGAVFNFFIASEQLPKLEDMVRRHPKVKVVIDHLARVDLEKKDPEPEINTAVVLSHDTLMRPTNVPSPSFNKFVEPDASVKFVKAGTTPGTGKAVSAAGS